MIYEGITMELDDRASGAVRNFQRRLDAAVERLKRERDDLLQLDTDCDCATARLERREGDG